MLVVREFRWGYRLTVFALCVHSVREELIRTVAFCVIEIASVFDTLSHVLQLVVYSRKLYLNTLHK